MRKILIAAVVALLVAAGCGGKKEIAKEAEKQAAPSGTAVEIPAGNVQFNLVEPDKEKRSGLYAAGSLDEKKISPPALFAAAADGNPSIPAPTAGETVTLVGKLPGTVWMNDYFVPDGGEIVGDKISIRAKFVNYTGEYKKNKPWAVYDVVSLPPLPAGKYKATISFSDYSYEGDKAKLKGPLLHDPPGVQPLACDFEVKGAEGAAAKPSAKFSAKCRKADDRVEAEVGDGQLVLTATSPSGIGSAEVKCAEGEWPGKVVINFVYAPNKPFAFLEGFDAEWATSANKESGEAAKMNFKRSGKEPKVELTAGRTAGNKTLKLSWIDAYR